MEALPILPLLSTKVPEDPTQMTPDEWAALVSSFNILIDYSINQYARCNNAPQAKTIK